MRPRMRRILVIVACVTLVMTALSRRASAQGRGGDGASSAPRVNLNAPGEVPRKGPPLPAPRDASGRVVLFGTADGKGIWMPVLEFGAHLLPPTEIPFQPWAKRMYEDRGITQLEPHTRCKPSGGVRQLQTPYGVEIIELVDAKRIFIFDVGGPHTFRTVYMDGRTHPVSVTPTYYGHSIGWWEGKDTLVIDTVGYSESFWLDRKGLPSTEHLHTIERFTRRLLDTTDYEITIDDPHTYTRPFTAKFELRLEPAIEPYEYICQEANYAEQLMIREGAKNEFGSDFIP